MVSVTAIWLRRAVQILLLGVLFVGLMMAREIQRGEAALRASDAAFHRGELEQAVHEARTAAESYVPAAPHVERAYARLEAIGRGAEAEGRLALSRTAWGAVRSAVLETRPWLPSRAEELARAERALGRLGRAEALRTEAGVLSRPDLPAEPSGELEALLAARGELSSGARFLRLGLLATGFFALALGLGWAGFRVIDAQGRVRRSGLVLSFSLCIGGTVCWLLAVMVS